jgi:hypothetical protein
VPQNRPYIAPPFQQAQDDVFGGGPVPGAQAFLANLNFQDGNAAPQLTPDSVILARERLPGSDVRINLPSVVFVQCDGYSGIYTMT